MTLHNEQPRPSYPPQPNHEPTTREGHQGHVGHGAHRLMMLVCCIPMIVIVVALVASGTAGAGAFVWALGCVAMMVAMMFMMPGGHDHK